MPWLAIGNTFLSIINLILVSYHDLGFFDESFDDITRIEIFVGVLFAIEFVYNTWISNKFFKLFYLW